MAEKPDRSEVYGEAGKLLANPVLAAISLLPPIAGMSGAMISYIHKVGALNDASQRFELLSRWDEEMAADNDNAPKFGVAA
jgi:hypothetical protein